MNPTDKAAIERMIMRIGSMVQVNDGASIAGALTLESDIVSPDRLRALIEEAISRYHAEPHGRTDASPSATWSWRSGHGKA